MSQFLQKLLPLVQKVIPQIKTIDGLKRLIKWAVAVFTFAYWYKYHRSRAHDNIPTWPNRRPLIGHLLVPFRHWRHINQFLYENIKQLGFPPIIAMTTWRNVHGIMITDPDVLKFVFCTKFEKFEKGERIRTELAEMLGDGIFASDPPKWQFHRKVASRMFSMRNLKDYMFQCTVEHTKKVLTKIKSSDDIVNDIDIYNMLARFTLDCFTAIAFGKSVESTDMYPKEHAFAEAFDSLMEQLAVRHITPPFIWKALRMLPFEIGNEGAIKRNIKIINEFADQVITSRQQAISRIQDEDGNKYNDIISLFIKKSNKKLTNDQLKFIAMNMIIAGRDTTRLLLSWFLYEMTQRKDICNKIYKEIDDYIKDNNTNEMSYNKVGNNLLWLESTLLETLRLNPVVPFLIRHAVEDVKLPNGNIIRQGNEVCIPTYVFARNPKIYKDPLKYDPNRFYNKDQTPLNVFDVYHYPYFNVNPRLCLGRTLALMEMKVFVFYFFQQYHFEMADPNQEIKIKTGIVLNMETGLRLKLTPRSNNTN